MTTLTEGQHAGEFMVSEANGSRSRETKTLILGQNLSAGAVLGEITKSGSATSAADAGNTGNGAMGAVTVSAGANVGDYVLSVVATAANAGAFEVENPDGVNIGTGDVAAAFSDGGLAFTLADGATDFAVGDRFIITVVAGSGKYTEYNPTNTDGSETAVAVLYDNVDASAADVDCVIIAREAEVASSSLQWFTGATANQIITGKAELSVATIIAR